MALFECRKASGGKDLRIKGNIALALSNRSNGTSNFRMFAQGEGHKSDAFIAIDEGTSTARYQATKSMDIMIEASSSGGYNTQWDFYKNDVIVWTNTGVWANYWDDFYSDIIHLEKDDIIYVNSRHQQSGGNTNSNRVNIIEMSNKLITNNKDVLILINDRLAKTSWQDVIRAFTWNSDTQSASARRRFISEQFFVPITTSTLKVLKDINVKLHGISRNGYNTKWKFIVNDNTVYEDASFIEYDVPIESDVIALSKDDVIQLQTTHQNNSVPLYEISILELIK